MKGKKKKQFIVFLIILAVLAAFAVFYTIAMFNVKAQLPRASFVECFTLAFPVFWENPNIYIQTFREQILLVGAFLLLIITMIMVSVTTRRMHRNDGPNAKGDAHWMTEEEKEMYYRRHIMNPATYPNEPTVTEKSKDGERDIGTPIYKKKLSEKQEELCKQECLVVSESIYLNFDNNWARKNTNALIIGTAGSGKSRFYVGPNILQANTNYIITDPSGDLFNQYAKFLENEGYTVDKIDLTDMYHSSRYNPLFYIENEKDVFTLVNMISENMSSAGADKEEPIWKNTKEALIKAIILYLWKYTEDDSAKNLTNVLRIISSAKMDDDDSYENAVDEIFRNIRSIDPNGAAISQYDIFASAGAGKTRDSIIISANSMLALFGLDDVRHLTSSDNVHLETFADTKRAIFLCIPTEDTTYNFIASMLYSQLFLRLYDYAEKTAHLAKKVCIDFVDKDGHAYKENIRVFQAKNKEESEGICKEKAETLIKHIKRGLVVEYSEAKDLYYIKTKPDSKSGYEGEIIAWRGDADKNIAKERAEAEARLIEQHAIIKNGDYMKLPEHCHFILDEFANTGKIPGFCQKLSTIRKYRISCSIIIQSPDQLKNMYEKEANVIIDNCNVKLFLGTNSPETAKWVSEMLGDKTVRVASTSINSNNQGGSTSIGLDKQPLMAPNQVLAEDEKAIVMIQGGYNKHEPKYEITKHPNYKKAKATEGKFVLLVDEAKKDTTNWAKAFSESLTKSENEKTSTSFIDPRYQPEDEIGASDIADMYNETKKQLRENSIKNKNTANHVRSHKNYEGEGKEAINTKTGTVSPEFIKKAGLEGCKTKKEVEEKIEDSSCMTDYTEDEFYWNEES